MSRLLRPAVLALVGAACASAVTAGPQFVSPRPVAATIDCLATALDSAGYAVKRVDRRKGVLEAMRETEQKEKSSDPRLYEVGDRLLIEAAKDRKTYTVTPGSYRELRSQLGAERQLGSATPTSTRDAAYFADRCKS